MIDNTNKSVVDNTKGSCKTCKPDVTEINNRFVVEETVVSEGGAGAQSDEDLFE